MYIERTSYYARPGQAEAVGQTRRDACEVRRRLGLSAGSVYLKAHPGDDGPDVQWECAYATTAEHDADLAARATSPEFEAVRKRMRGLIDRFERHFLYADRPQAADHWAGDVRLEGLAIAPREVAYPSDGRSLAGYLYLPPGPGPFPCMVVNHGSGVHQGSNDVCKPSVASVLMSWGIACLYPHRRGYGNSPGTPWREDVSAEFGSEAYDRQLAARLDVESDDVVAAFDYLKDQPEIRGANIGVMGSSFGGTNTLLAAAKCADFRCAVEFAGAAMNWERTANLRRLMFDAAARLTQPIFFIQAANDYSVAPTRELAASLEGSGKDVEAKIYPAFGLTTEEGHLFERHGMLVWGPDVRRFLERCL